MINSFLTSIFCPNNSNEILMDIHTVSIYDILTIQVNIAGIAILCALFVKMLIIYIKSLKLDTDTKVDTFRQYSIAFMLALLAHILPSVIYIVISDKTNHILDLMFSFTFVAPNWLLYMILKYNYISLIMESRSDVKHYNFKLTNKD